MQQQHSGQHLMGQKQYELTNHRGDVQVTVSDLPYKHGNDTMTHISPALKAVYDYYPFGSPMPGRTIMDTARKCVDMTRLDRVWRAWEMTMTEIYLQCLINYHLDGEGKVFIDDYGAVEVEIADEYAVFYMDLQDSLNNGGEMVLHIDWLKEFSEKGFLLTLQGMDATGEMRVFYQKHYEKPEDAVYLNIADSFTNISVGIQGNVHFRIDNIRYTGGSWVNEEVLVRVCDDGGDRYRFGFNGQEKVNEMSGMGNHNTAEFWEYDTRLGRRWNLDPVDQISVSNYAVFRNNPLVYTDVDGNQPGRRAYHYAARKLKLQNHEYLITNIPNSNDVVLSIISVNNGVYDVSSIIFKENYIEKLERYNNENTPYALYKYVQHNPLVNGIMNLMSGVLGRDMSMKSMEEIQETGDDISGNKISVQRRVTKGIEGAAQIVGIGIAGSAGMMTDIGVDVGLDLVNAQGKDIESIKTGITVLQFLNTIREGKPNKASAELFNKMIEKGAKEVDKTLEKK